MRSMCSTAETGCQTPWMTRHSSNDFPSVHQVSMAKKIEVSSKKKTESLFSLKVWFIKLEKFIRH